MNQRESSFLYVPSREWLFSNGLAFPILDGVPISHGPVLVATRRIVAKGFGATDAEQVVLMALVKQFKHLLGINFFR